METFERYLNHEIACPCGRTHFVPIERVEIGENALASLYEYVLDRHVHCAMVIDDIHTRDVLGDRLCNLFMDSHKVAITHVTFEDDGHLSADDAAIDRAKDAIAASKPELVIAVGSGTITDITRYASFVSGIPFVSVPTAPSVDGYASTVAALQLNGMKVTKSAHAPMAIFALPSVMADAPAELIQAGFGDLVGKATSLLDWRLATVLYGENWCEEAFRLVDTPLRYCVQQADRLKERDPEVIAILFSGLLSSGIAMAMMGNSRPASGCEHHFSHYWDFKAFRGVRPYRSHGLQVGFAVHFTMNLYEYLPRLESIYRPRPLVIDEEWIRRAHERWGDAAAEVVREQSAKAEWLQDHDTRLSWIGLTGETLADMIDLDLEFFSKARSALLSIGIPDRPPYVDVTAELLQETLLHANEVRSRFTVLDFYMGQGLLGALSFSLD